MECPVNELGHPGVIELDTGSVLAISTSILGRNERVEIL
jgi:hypothetical protein